MLTFPTLITGTITGLRISAVDGTAFIDNAGATIPTYADGNHSIEIYDSSNRMLKGVLKAAGTSETYTDLITGDDSTFTSDTGFWNKGDGWSIGSGVATHNGTAGDLLHSNLGLNLALYKYSLSSAITVPGLRIYCGGNYTSYSSSGVIVGYITSGTLTIWGVRGTGGSNLTIDDLIIKQVLTPSSSGATIVSAKGGAIYNFASKDASFTYNDASYRYAIYDTLKVSRPTRYMGVSTHNI